MTVTNLLLVGLGGAFGALFRFFLSFFSNQLFQSEFPFSTFFINIIGCIALGGFLRYHSLYHEFNEGLKLFVMVGVLGGFTTFSAFSMEAISLLNNSKYLLGCIYIFFSVFLSLLGFTVGYLLSNKLLS